MYYVNFIIFMKLKFDNQNWIKRYKMIEFWNHIEIFDNEIVLIFLTWEFH